MIVSIVIEIRRRRRREDAIVIVVASRYGSPAPRFQPRFHGRVKTATHAAFAVADAGS
jgi:hypothetical protein